MNVAERRSDAVLERVRACEEFRCWAHRPLARWAGAPGTRARRSRLEGVSDPKEDSTSCT
jgi:hypothetical protein